MRARDLMTSPAVTCHPNHSLATAAQRMAEHDCGSLAVIDDSGRLAGTITDRDICMAAYTRGAALAELPVQVAMRPGVIAAGPDETLKVIEELMAENQLRRIPIIDDAGRPIGIVSLNDLAIESIAPDTRMKHGPAKVAYTLAAICRPPAAHRTA
ncbi:MAG: CBS domain-containing protein [Deltaproteobacteria bacterium]